MDKHYAIRTIPLRNLPQKYEFPVTSAFNCLSLGLHGRKSFDLVNISDKKSKLNIFIKLSL